MEKYYKYTKIFSGARNIDDINFIKSKCPTEDHKIIDIVIKSKELIPEIGYKQMNIIVKDLQNLKSKEECEKYLSDIRKTLINSNNIISVSKYLSKFNECDANYDFTPLQKEIFDKILIYKPEVSMRIEIPKIECKCPHCEKINSVPLGSSYVICGVDTEGRTSIENYDNYCFNDWCFVCKKKLCKNWFKDELYIDSNKKHNNICCRIHANKNKLSYPEDYCQCSRRNDVIII